MCFVVMTLFVGSIAIGGDNSALAFDLDRLFHAADVELAFVRRD